MKGECEVGFGYLGIMAFVTLSILFTGQGGEVDPK